MKKIYDFDKIIDRTSTDCEKWDNRTAIFATDNVIPLWVADMDFESGDFIIDALRRRVDHSVFGYTFRSRDYTASIQGWLKRRSGWDVESDWVAFSPGVVTGATFAILACTKPGDGVLIQQPVYHPFAIITKANDRKVVNNGLIYTEKGYRIDFEDFEKKLSQVKAFILCNPHNPTGRAFTEAELRQMGELCVKHNVTIISDEIHSDFVYAPNRHTHIAALDKRFAEHTITFVAPSKSFNLAGFFTAVAIIPNPQLMTSYQREIKRYHADNSNIMGMEALKAAYTHGDQWMDQLKEYLEGNIDYVVNFLAKNLPSVRCIKPEATYLMWLDFSAWGMTQDQLNDALVNKAGLGMTSGAIFGDAGVGFQRLNIGTRRSLLVQAMEQLLEFKTRSNNL